MADGFTSPRVGAFLRRAYPLLIVGAALAAPVALGSCAKSPTVILAAISVDDTVPPVSALRSTISRDSDPSHPATSTFTSLFAIDGGPVPYVFPVRLPINVPPGWTGAVTIVIDSLDGNTYAVNATGTTSAQAVPQQQTEAMLTLTGVSGGGDTDGGTDGGTAADGGDGGGGDQSSDDSVDDTVIDNDAGTERR